MTGASVAELYRYFVDELEHDQADDHDQDADEKPDHGHTRPRLTLTVTLDPLPCAGCGTTVPPAAAIAGYSADRPLCRSCLARLGLADLAATITAALWARHHLDSPDLPAAVSLHLWRLHDAALAWAADRLRQVEP